KKQIGRTTFRTGTQQFPLPADDGSVAEVEQPIVPLSGSLQYGKHASSVQRLPAPVVYPRQIAKGGQYVHVAGYLIHHQAAGKRSGPPDNGRHPHAAFPFAPLGPPQRTVVAPAFGMTSVITLKNNHGIAVDPQL